MKTEIKGGLRKIEDVLMRLDNPQSMDLDDFIKTCHKATEALAITKALRDAVPDNINKINDKDFCYQNGLADNSGSCMTLTSAKILNDLVGGGE